MTEERLAAEGLQTLRGSVADVLLSGRYRLRDELGSGTAGHVYRAFDVLLQREVAVKVLDRIHDEVGVARAIRAARVAARANHDRLFEVLDVERGRPSFVTLGLIAGRPLGVELATGRPPRTRALGVADDLLGALAALHQAGAVHRGVCLDNVWLGEDGRIRLTSASLTEAAHDPGLGLRVGADPARRPEVAPSPEQGLGVPADARSDVAAAAAVMRVLLEPDDSDPVGKVLARAGHEDPDRRYTDAGQLCAALWEALATPPVIFVPDPPRALPAPLPPPPVPAIPEPVPAKPERQERNLLARVALALAAGTAAWLLIGEPFTGFGTPEDRPAERPSAVAAVPTPTAVPTPAAVPTPTEAATTSPPSAITPPPVLQPTAPPDRLPAQELRRILDAAEASTVDLGPATFDLLARLQNLDRLRGVVREAEATDLYGLAALDAAAGTNSASISADIAALLQPELSLDGLIAFIDRDPAAVGTMARTFATRLRVLDGLEGEARKAGAFDLWLSSQAGAADGSLSARFDVAARAVLAEIAEQ